MTYFSRETSPHPLGQAKSFKAMAEAERLAALHAAGISIIQRADGTWHIKPGQSIPRPRPAPNWTDSGVPDLQGELAEW
jgi:hypothetical protein